ncbi:hypothetical protein Q4R59_12050 [Morganella morganii]
MSREILTLKKGNKAVTIQADTSAPKSAQNKTQQEVLQRPQQKNKAEAHAKKRKLRTVRIAQHRQADTTNQKAG